MWKSTWRSLQFLLTISILYIQTLMEKWGLLALPPPPLSYHLHSLPTAITAPLGHLFMSWSASKSGPDHLLLSQLVVRSQIHTNTSRTSQIHLHPLPFFLAQLTGRRWATAAAAAAAKQQITRGLLIPRRVSRRSTQLESLHLNR